ncbi:MAG: hypothetical protein EOO63_12645 [Hymenobacter sp.]|nr:MAG: hypothetical protein EOO63_12645 [Hymenobacter sp.]
METDLFAEYLESIGKDVTSINRDVTSIKKGLETQPQAKDYSLQLENLTAGVQALRAQAAKPVATPAPVVATPTLDVAALMQQLREVVREEVKRHHPGYVMTKWVWYGTATLIGLAMLVSVTAAGWWQAAQDRDHYARSNWFWRFAQQTSRPYTNDRLTEWRQDSVKFQQNVEQLEAKELLLLQASQKQQEAAALRAQAVHGKKK